MKNNHTEHGCCIFVFSFLWKNYIRHNSFSNKRQVLTMLTQVLLIHSVDFHQDFSSQTFFFLKCRKRCLNKHKKSLISLSKKHHMQCVFCKIFSPLSRSNTEMSYAKHSCNIEISLEICHPLK